MNPSTKLLTASGKEKRGVVRAAECRVYVVRHLTPLMLAPHAGKHMPTFYSLYNVEVIW